MRNYGGGPYCTRLPQRKRLRRSIRSQLMRGYTFTGDKVTHHIEICWSQVLGNQVRSVKLQGDRLTVRRRWLVGGVMYSANSELVWERMKRETTDK